MGELRRACKEKFKEGGKDERFAQLWSYVFYFTFRHEPYRHIW